MKMRIRAQVFLPVLLVLVLLPLTAYLMFSMTAEQYMQDAARKDLNGLLLAVQPLADKVFRNPDDADTITPDQLELVEQAQVQEFIGKIRPLLRNSDSGAQILVLDADFQTVYPRKLKSGSNNARVYDYFAARLIQNPHRFQQEQMERITLNEQTYLVDFQEMATKTKVRAKYLIAYSPAYDASMLLGGVSKLVLLITASLAVISLAAMWLVAGSISRPIQRLCDHAERIGRGDFHRIEEKTSVREIGDLTDAMNRMSVQLGNSDEVQKTFFQNASHELRTPLMSISGYAQGIQCGVFPDNAEAAGIIISESMRLTELVDGILALSRMDNQRQALELRPVSLNAFLGDCLKKLEGMALGRGVSLRLEEDAAELCVKADEELFFRSFYNVASNALRYATQEVRISVSSDGRQGIVTVKDDGPGFSNGDADHLFERFYKGKGGNFGIGLAIAKSSMEYMGGSISACNTGSGASFTLRLNLLEEDPA